MNFLEKVRALPESKRKLLFWTIILLFSAVLLFFYVKRAKKELEEFKGIEFPRVEIEKELKELQYIEKESK